MTRTANNEFIAASREFDALMSALQQLRAENFRADPEAQRHWGDVGSVAYLNDRLREALAHYGITITVTAA